MKTKRGFTLIELIIVIACLGLIMVSVSSILFNSFKAKNKISYQQSVEDEGQFILSELRRRVMEASDINQVGENFSFTENEIDILVSCGAGETMSIGGTEVTGRTRATCSDFATVSGKSVDIGFTLSIGNQSAGQDMWGEKSFKTTIFLRN